VAASPELDHPTPGDGTLTIGVAIAVPAPFGDDLQRWRLEFGDPLAHAIPVHVTLLPPTPVEAARLEQVHDHLTTVAAKEQVFDICLRGTGTFRPVSPVVFVQLAEGAPECERVQRGVRTGLLERRLPFDYHPHVTVAHDVPGPALDLALDTLSDYEATFRVGGFHLYEHGSDGVWRPHRHYAFRPGPASAGELL
jgi:2'-5' RNA ligase